MREEVENANAQLQSTIHNGDAGGDILPADIEGLPVLRWRSKFAPGERCGRNTVGTYTVPVLRGKQPGSGGNALHEFQRSAADADGAGRDRRSRHYLEHQGGGERIIK